jgi:hypothetical protein
MKGTEVIYNKYELVDVMGVKGEGNTVIAVGLR